MDIKNVRKWCREFIEGRINVHDEQRSGRPSLPESTVARIDEMVRANRRITLEEIEDGQNEDCSHFSVHKIVSETLGYRKVSARSPIPLFWHNQSIQLARDDSAELMVQALPGTGLPMLWTPSQRVGVRKTKPQYLRKEVNLDRVSKQTRLHLNFQPTGPLLDRWKRNFLECPKN
ncbi:hypothetical protein LAZ67_19002277 [Cordylochernes scorpioides]|uniref:Transposase n=1 Tax=Cordylochernes scorpioides TaxID=51811 RepID=A0ABY6LK36_9ARAC|nr:hypothetical protein LAZ67_19002277 [Cordylochernes scorpioides]